MENRRTNRHLVQVAGRYRPRHGQSRDIWIKDISEQGCRFFDKFSILKVDAPINVRVGNIGPITATVKWRERSIVGAVFDRPIHPSVLRHILDFMDEKDEDGPDEEGDSRPVQNP